MNAASSLNLRTAVGKSQIFDCFIQLGGNAAKEIASSVTMSINNDADEAKWIGEFLDEREKRLNSMGDVYAATVTRVNSYRYMVQRGVGYLNFDGNAISALDNDGNVVVLKCDEDVLIQGGENMTDPNKNRNIEVSSSFSQSPPKLYC